MIRINLLPADHRRGNRISPKVLATSFGSALAVAASIGWFGIVYFGQLGELESQHATLAAELQQKSKKVGYFDKLEANRQDYGTRVQTIQEIGRSRRVWSKFMDELIDTVNNGGDTERHLAWFDSVQVKTDPKVRAASVTLPGWVQGNDMARVANLHRDIEQAPFFPDLQSKTGPNGKQVPSKDRIPPEAFQMSIDLKFKPPVEQTKGTPPAAPKK